MVTAPVSNQPFMQPLPNAPKRSSKPLTYGRGKAMIEPITGEPGRYYAHSQTTQSDCYVVDLTESLPRCSCTDFTVRRLPKLLENWQVVTSGEGRNVCKHIVEAMAWEHAWDLEARAREYVGRLAVIGGYVGRVVSCEPYRGCSWPEFIVNCIGVSLVRRTAYVVKDGVLFARSWAEAEKMTKMS
jgi:hypothetical protein